MDSLKLELSGEKAAINFTQLNSQVNHAQNSRINLVKLFKLRVNQEIYPLLI